MKVVVLQACAFWDAEAGRQELTPAPEPVELAADHAREGIAAGWLALPGADAEKARTTRRAPERKG